MVYYMKINVDGGCRNNGYHGAIGAAAAVFTYQNGGSQPWEKRLYAHENLTNQRAELEAVLLALSKARDKSRTLRSQPWLNITIYADSKYAVNCMTKLTNKWIRNGWLTSSGRNVANRDLIEAMLNLDNQLRQIGNIRYVWIPRAQNTEADRHCNNVMDQMRQQEAQQYF